MPSEADHRYKAENNKRFAEQITSSDPTASGWHLTVLFYSALHYVEAYNARYNSHFWKHEERDRDIAHNSVLSPIYADYRDLATFSSNARYKPVKYGQKEVDEARLCHAAVAGHVSNLLGW